MVQLSVVFTCYQQRWSSSSLIPLCVGFGSEHYFLYLSAATNPHFDWYSPLTCLFNSGNTHCAAISILRAEIEISDREKAFYCILFLGFRRVKITSTVTILAHLKFNGILDLQKIQEEECSRYRHPRGLYKRPGLHKHLIKMRSMPQGYLVPQSLCLIIEMSSHSTMV